jgi:hypothetical protein
MDLTLRLPYLLPRIASRTAVYCASSPEMGRGASGRELAENHGVPV